MTHCRTGCGAEINYKRVHFSSSVEWCDIPMEGDVIHECPLDANDVLKELQGMHGTLFQDILYDMVYDYGSQISDFVDLPEELKTHSKGKLADRMRAEKDRGHPQNVPEEYDKLPEVTKKIWKSTYGFESPNTTPEQRIADFRSDINRVMSFLQRCVDRFPVPFYTHEGYSQLELFRIFLESQEQYGDAMICHTIQGVIEQQKSQMVTGLPGSRTQVIDKIFSRLETKIYKQREQTRKELVEIEEKLISEGMSEQQASVTMQDNLGPFDEATSWVGNAYQTEIMGWALDLYKKEFDKTIEKNKQDGEQEHRGEQIEADDTAVKEQSSEELLKPHSQEYFGDLHKKLREFILKLHEGKINWAELGADEIYDQIQAMKDKQSKTSYTFANKSDLGVATLGQLVAILRNPVTAEKAKQEGISEYESVVNVCKVVLSCRNNMDHDERKELPPSWKAANAGLCTMLNEFFDNLKYR